MTETKPPYTCSPRGGARPGSGHKPGVPHPHTWKAGRKPTKATVRDGEFWQVTECGATDTAEDCETDTFAVVIVGRDKIKLVSQTTGEEIVIEKRRYSY